MAMHFIKSPDPSIGEVDLSEHLRKVLYSGQKALWIISGGSNIPTTTTVIQRLDDAPLEKLTIIFGDERYGQVDHADSNAKQLEDLGFDPLGAKMVSVLENKSLGETVKDYSHKITQAVENADHIVAQIGIGTDGHICGILPSSIAITSQQPVVAYKGEDFTRLTITPKTLAQVNVAYVFAYGAAKKDQLERLRNKDLPIAVQPAQLLKQIPDVYVYNNQLEDRS